MRRCCRCKKDVFLINRDLYIFLSRCYLQLFGKWICSSCFLKIGRGDKKAIRKAKSKLRKKIPPKSIGHRSLFRSCEERGKIKFRKRWVMEDLNRVFESYKVLKPLSLLELHRLKIIRKPKNGQMIWREIVFKKELEDASC